jgi:CRISP-associated protein Cas1
MEQKIRVTPIKFGYWKQQMLKRPNLERVQRRPARWIVRASTRALGEFSMLNQNVFTPPRLAVAFAKVHANHGMAGVDGVTVDDFAQRAPWALDQLADELARDRYQAQPLRRMELCLPGKAPRVLAVPAVRDRVVQTAVAQHLSPISESLFHEASHGYRPARSIYTALHEVNTLLASGKAWVLDADIRQFFASIPHRSLLSVVGKWLPDPAMLSLIEHWLAVGATTPGIGIAQGSPLSPLLANIYLHGFDQRITREGIAHVRYADDFVALLPDKDAAQRAQALAGQALTELGLELHPDKTRVVHHAEGFRFLGAAFGKIAYQAPATTRLSRQKAPVSNDAPAAHVLPNAPAKLPATEPLIAAPPPAAPMIIPSHESRAGALRSLYLVEQGTLTRQDGERFIVVRGANEVGSFHASNVDVLLAFGNAAITLPAMRLALSHGIPIVLADLNGRFTGIVDNHDDRSVALHAAQFRVAADAQATLELARAIVLGKLDNAITLLHDPAMRHCTGVAQHAQAMRRMRALARSANTLEALRGCEGFAAKSFYAALKEIMGPAWGFDGRNRRPPRDPVNAMLSFGYALLSHNVYALAKAQGLNAHVGYLHPARPAHPALISDLMEEFRAPVVDRLVLTLVTEGRMRPDDFTQSAESGCLLNPPARRRFIAAFEDVMGGRSSTKPGAPVDGYRAVIQAQMRHLVEFFRLKTNSYEPHRYVRQDQAANSEA